MIFENVKQEVFKLEDIDTLVESIRIEIKQGIAVVFNLERHMQRLLNSIQELGFSLPEGISADDFFLFFHTQIKNRAQYKFNSPVMFSNGSPRGVIASEATRQSITSIYKLRLIYNKNSNFQIEIEKYKKDLNKEWTVKILTQEEFHIESTNPIWQHKFLPRPDFTYFFNQGYDEVIWRDEKGNICEGSFTAIIFDENKSPKANTLPSTSLKFFELDFAQTKELEGSFYLLNSMMVKKISTVIAVHVT